MRISDWSSDVCSSDLFTTEGMNRKAFVNHKERVNAQKKFIDVKLSDISLYRYPGSDDQLMLAEFTQHYRSDNYKLDSRKQQFWKRDGNGEWKIFREASRSDERGVGKEGVSTGRYRWSTYIIKQKRRK